MEIIDRENRTVGFTENELILLANALNEVCNGIDIPEFDTRLGVSIDEARKLQKEINTLF